MECLFFITNLYDIFMRTVHNYAAHLQYVCKLFLSFNPFFRRICSAFKSAERLILDFNFVRLKYSWMDSRCETAETTV